MTPNKSFTIIIFNFLTDQKCLAAKFSTGAYHSRRQNLFDFKSQVVFVVGLPGAGKTEYIRSQYPEIVWSVFDDYFRESLDNNSLKNGVQFDKLIDDIRNNKSCVISDIHFCRVWALEEALKVLKDEFQTFQPTVIFFSNEPEKCAKNVNTRDRDRETKDRELGLIKELSLDYKPDNKHSWQMIRDVWESK